MAKLMNSAKWMINLPVWPEGFGKTCAEFLLCGGEVISNKMIGVLSAFDYSIEEARKKENYKGNYVKFWERAAAILGETCE
jgi:hypothetical protein